MMSWDLVFWANKETVDYIPSSWALDELTYKWPQGVSQEVRQGLIDTCDPLKNIKYRTSRGIARKKGITDLQKAKALCERALYTSSVDTTTDTELSKNVDNDSSSDDQNVEPLKKTARYSEGYSTSRKSRETRPAFTPPIATKSLGGGNPCGNTGRLNAGLNKPSDNSRISSSDDEDVPLKELVLIPSTRRKLHVTAEGSNVFTPSIRQSLFQETPSVKKQKVRCMTQSPSVFESGHIELDTGPSEPVTLTASERLMLKEIKKLNWDIQDMKKTVNKVHDLLVTNNLISIESASEEPFQLPIENQTLLESLEQHLADEKNIEVLAQRLYLCGGETTHKSIFLLMKKLFSRGVAMLYSGTGKKGKLSFQKLSCYKAVTKAIRKRFADATDTDINRSISLYLAGAADREGGRKIR